MWFDKVLEVKPKLDIAVQLCLEHQHLYCYHSKETEYPDVYHCSSSSSVT